MDTIRVQSAERIPIGKIWKNNNGVEKKVQDNIFRCSGPNDQPYFSDKYMGIRFAEGQDTLYGWLHLSMDDGRVQFHDCSFQRKY